jgi:hypothetical protein
MTGDYMIQEKFSYYSKSKKLDCPKNHAVFSLIKLVVISDITRNDELRNIVISQKRPKHNHFETN